MKNNKLIYTASSVALIALFAAGVNATDTTKTDTTAPTTTTTTTPPTNGEESTGECWMWPSCIVIN